MKFDIESVCITAMYMAMGANEALKALPEDKYQEIVDHCSGHMGLMCELSEFAVKSELKLLQEDRDCPGVFDYDYEVSEPFGAWYVETRLNHTGDATKELYRRIDEFFAK